MRNFISGRTITRGSVSVMSDILASSIDLRLSEILPKEKGLEFQAAFVGSTALGLNGPMSDIDVCVAVNSLRQAAFWVGAKHVENWSPAAGRGVRFNSLVLVPDLDNASPGIVGGPGAYVNVSFYLIDWAVGQMIMDRYASAVNSYDPEQLQSMLAHARDVYPSDPKAFFYSSIGIPVLRPVG